MKSFLQELIDQQIYLSLDKDELSVKIPKTGIDPSIIGEIKKKKQDLIKYLKDLEGADSNDITPLPSQNDYALSFSQKLIWKFSSTLKGSIAYNKAGTIDIVGSIESDKFYKAIHAIIDRHEVLRTVFRKNESNEVRQYVLKREEIAFEIDYRNYIDTPNAEEIIGSYINNQAKVPFDFEKGALFKTCLFRVDRDRCIFFYNIHSIICDRESIDILTRDIMLYLEAYKLDHPVSLNNLQFQFKDFAAWQLDQSKNGQLNECKDYWQKTFKGDIPRINFPKQKERPIERTFNGKLLGANINVELSNNIKTFIQNHGGNLFRVVLASWKVVFYELTKQKDLIVGGTVLGKYHSDLVNQIGPYTNIIPFRNRLDPEGSFLEFYEKIKNSMIESASFQIYPYQKIIEDLELDQNTNRNPIFDILITINEEEQILEDFVLSGNEEGTIVEGGIGKKYVDMIVTKYDLEIDVRELSQTYWFNFNYNTDIYEKETIIDLIDRYRRIISTILSNPNLSIKSIIETSSFLKEKVKQ